jgi:hypothetical protein
LIETASIDDVILQLVSEGVGSGAKIAAEISVPAQIVRKQISSLIEAGKLEKDGRCYRLSSTEAAKPLQGTEQQEEDSLEVPDLLEVSLIPTICLAAAKWFPAPWLTIPGEDRRKLVERFAPVYDSFKPLIISEGHESAEQKRVYEIKQ